MAEFFTKRNDTKALTAQFKDTTGAVVDITGASVVFTMTGPDNNNTKKVDRGTVTITTASTGKVSYPWQSGETNQAGLFKGEFEVTYSSGLVETFPAEGAINIRIAGDLDDT